MMCLSVCQDESWICRGAAVYRPPLVAAWITLQSEGVCPCHVHLTPEGIHSLGGYCATTLRASTALPEGLLATRQLLNSCYLCWPLQVDSRIIYGIDRYVVINQNNTCNTCDFDNKASISHTTGMPYMNG